MRRIAVTNLKGGSTKTTTAAALAVGLARLGRRVLAVDTDPSGNLSWTLLGGAGAPSPTLAAVLTREAAAVEAIRPTTMEGLDLLPADSSLAGVNIRLAQELGRDTRLRSALASVEGSYDAVVIDTGPTLSTLLVNALVAAHEVVVPVDPGVYAVLGLVALEETLAEVREAYGVPLRLAGLLVTRAVRSNVCRDVEKELRARYGPLVFGAVIPHAAAFEEAATRGLTILDHAPRSAGARAYTQFVEEVWNDGERTSQRGGGQAGGPAGAVGAA